jgi:acetoin:2,6-dichlorophenolindophenol oxidoreductase subunit beta
VTVTKYWKAAADALRLEMQQDPRIVVLGEDVAGGGGREAEGIVDAWGGPFGITRGLIGEFGSARVRDTPISEAGFVGIAAGLAADGYRPWVDIMFTELLALAWDQLTNRIARSHYLSAGQLPMPLTIKTFGDCYSALCHYPGLVCVAPSDPYSAKGLMAAAIRSDDPVVVFDNLKLLRRQGEVPDEAYVLPIGRARVVRPGRSLTLLGIGATTSLCLDAAAELETAGHDVEVVDLLTLAPWDVAGVTESVRRTGRLLVVDHDHPNCGLAASICATVTRTAWDDLLAPPTFLAPPSVPAMGMDGNPALASLYYPDVPAVVGAVTAVLDGSRHPIGRRG